MEINNNITYTIINGEATVTGFTGEPEFLVIPSEIDGCPVTGIRDNAFYKCTALKQIILPETLEYMGHHCFFQCTALESVDLPSGLTEMGMGCFCQCTSLSYVTLPDSISRIPDSCFRNCTSLRDIDIPQNVREIEKFAFSGCTSLSEVTMDENLTSIGDFAFFMCGSLTDVYIPASVSVFGTEAIGYAPDVSGHSVPETFSISAESGSPAEDYAAENSISFRTAGDETGSFSLRDIRNAPTELPEVFGIAGLIFLSAALLSAFRKKLFRRIRRRS